MDTVKCTGRNLARIDSNGNRVLPVTVLARFESNSLPASVRDATGKAEWDTCSPRGGSVARPAEVLAGSRCVGEEWDLIH